MRQLASKIVVANAVYGEMLVHVNFNLEWKVLLGQSIGLLGMGHKGGICWSILELIERWLVAKHLLKLQDTSLEETFEPRLDLADSDEDALAMLDFVLKFVRHGELVAILDGSIGDPNRMDHRVTIEPVLATVGWDVLRVGTISQVNSRDILGDCSNYVFVKDGIRVVLVVHWREVTHQIWVPLWVLVQNSVKQEQSWLMEEPLKPVHKGIKLLFDRQGLEVLEVVYIVLGQIYVMLVYQLAFFLVDVV
jgi:hypothetical protein